MVTMNSWWKDIFSGALAIGINERNLDKLQDESFLYLQGTSPKFNQYDYSKSKKNRKRTSVQL